MTLNCLRPACLAVVVLATTAVPAFAQASDPFTITRALGNQAVFSCGDFTASGNGNVADAANAEGGFAVAGQGSVVSDGNITMSGNAVIDGNATVGPGKKFTLSGNAKVNGTKSVAAAAAPCSPVDLSALGASMKISNDNVAIPKTAKGKSPLSGSAKTDFSLSGNDSLTIPAGTYYFTSWSVSGQVYISFAGDVRILCTGAVSMSGGSLAAPSNNPFYVRFWSSGSSLALSGQSGFAAFFYAPQAAASISGGAHVSGGIFVKSVSISGNSRVTRAIPSTIPIAIGFTESGAALNDGSLFRRAVNPSFIVSGGERPVAVSATLNGLPFSSGSTVSAEGTYRLVVDATDVIGHDLESSVSFGIDTTPPSFNPISPSDGSLLNRRVVTVSGGTDAVSVTVNGAAATVSGGVFSATVSLSEGLNAVTISGVDAAGNVGSRVVHYTVDTTSPAISISSPANGLLTKNTAVPVAGSVGDASAVSVMVNGAAATLSGGLFSVASVPLSEGTNPITAVATDAAGNTSSAVVTVVRDTVPPTISITDGGAPISDGSLMNHHPVPVVSASDAHLDTVITTLNGQPFSSGAAIPLDGSYDLLVIASDKVGNSSHQEVRFAVDTVPPAISAVSPPAGAFLTSATTSVSGACGDAVRVTINGTPAVVASGQFQLGTVSLPEGVATLSIVATDAAGNSSTYSEQVAVDTIPPSVAISSPADGSFLNSGSVTVSGMAQDANLSGVTVNGVSAVLGANGSFVAGPISFQDGTQTLTAVATDLAGHGASGVVSVTIDTKPPLISVTNGGQALSDGLLTNKPVVPVVTASDATSTTIDMRLNGATFASGTAVTADGAYRIDVTAKDAAGNTSAQSLNFTIDSQPPKIGGLQPADGSILNTPSVTISGTCEDAVAVTVNLAPAAVSIGAFTVSSVALTKGTNSVSISARDAAGNVGTATLTLALDTEPPVVVITDPKDGALTKDASISVSGTANDDHPASVSVNGGNATLAGSAFTRTGVPLAEGPNVVSATARDAAGNTAEAHVTATRDSTPPQVAITSPVSGAVIGVAKFDVSGTVSDPHLGSVSVNGVSAALSSGRFTASAVPLSAGTNTLVATATDAVGNSSTSSVTVSYDDRAPSVAITSPKDGSRLNKQPVDVTATAEGGTGITVAVNGQNATVSGTAFSVTGVPLNEGVNTLIARGTNDAGKQGVATISVTFDDVSPAVSSVTPPDGSRDLPLATVVRLVFSESVDPATVTPANITIVADGGNAVAGALSVDTSTVTFVPGAALAEETLYTVSVSAPVTDYASNHLASAFSSQFRTGSLNPPLPPALDQLPSAICASSVTVTGSTAPYLRVSVTGGAAVASGVADQNGRFSIEVTLSADSSNALAVVATDSQSRSSAPASATVRADCTPPTVSDASISPPALVITFSEAMDPATLTTGSTVTLSSSTGELSRSLMISSDGTAATVTGTTDLSKATFQLTVSTGAKDLAGNALAVPFVQSFTGQGGDLEGEIYDDRIGRPMPDAVATALSAGGASLADPKPVASSQTDGDFSLQTPAGEIWITVAKDGYLSVDRTEVVSAGQSTEMFDARLTPLTAGTADENGAAVVSDDSLILTIQGGAFVPGAAFRFADVSAQGLPGLLPLGWSSAAAVDLEATDGVAVAQTVHASWVNRAGLPVGSTPTVASYDRGTRRWIAAGAASVSADGKTIEADLPGTGSFAVVVPDSGLYAPPVVSAGEALSGVTPPTEDPILSATVTAVPAAVTPRETDTITVALSTSTPIPSGYPVEALVSEKLTTLSGLQEEIPSFLADLSVVHDPAGDSLVVFRVRPSDEAARVALSIGFEDVRVKHYPFEVRRGDLIPPSGGTVAGPGGFSLTVAGGAVTDAIPVTLSPVSQTSDLPIAIPTGYHFVSAVKVSLGEAALAIPATLRWASASDPSAGGALLWIEAASFGARLVPRLAARASYDSTAQTVSTLTPDPDLPLPGFVEGGVFVLVAADQPVAFARGRVLDVDASPLPGAFVSEDGTSLAAMADGSGRFATSFPAAGSAISSIRPDTGNVGRTSLPSTAAGSIVDADIHLAVTAPYVVSVAPDPAQPLPLASSIVVTFSEPLDPLSVGQTSATLEIAGTAVPASVTLAPSGAQLTLAPLASLPSNVDATLTISGSVKDSSGYVLVDATSKLPSDYMASYHTIDNTPPSGINPLLIYVGMPAGTPPSIAITGGPGSACGGCTVAAIDDTTQATATTVAGSDGSFTVTLSASTSDLIHIEIRKANGTSMSINPGPFRDDGGRTAIIGSQEADYLIADRIRLTFAEGSFNSATTVRATPVLEAQAPIPTPADTTFVGGVALDLGGVRSNLPIDIGVPAPVGSQAGDQFFAAVPVEALGQTYYMVLDTARLDGSEVTTGPATPLQAAALTLHSQSRTLHFQLSPSAMTEHSPGPAPADTTDPKTMLPRNFQASTIIILKMQETFDFIAGLTGDPAAIVLGNITPFVWYTPRAEERTTFYLPVPHGKSYSLSILDSVTGFTRFQGDFSGTTSSGGTITQLPPGATQLPDSTPPRLISADPAAVFTFTPSDTPVQSAAALAPGVSYSFSQQANGTDPSARNLAIRGDEGAVAPGVVVTLADNARSATARITADEHGAFELNLPSFSGDDFTLIVGVSDVDPAAALHLEFSEALGAQDFSKVVTLSDGTTALTMSVIPDVDSRGLTLIPAADFIRGHSYMVKLAAGTNGLKDIAGNAILSEIDIPLSSPAAAEAGQPQHVTDVNDLAVSGSLLLEATQTGGLLLVSAADPGAISSTPCGGNLAFGGATLRGVAADGWGRVVVAGGGGSDEGFVAVAHLIPDTSTPCGYHLAAVDGASTAIASALGDDASPLPAGFPRRVRLLSDDRDLTFVVDHGAVPGGLAVTETPDSQNPGQQRAGSPLQIVVAVASGKRGHPVRVTNGTTGQKVVALTDDSGSVTVSINASSGDSIDVHENASLLAVVANQGFGFDIVDVNATDTPSGASPAPESTRLLIQFDGTYSTGHQACIDPASQCPPSFECHQDLADPSDNYCYAPLCRLDINGYCDDALDNINGLNDLDIVTTPNPDGSTTPHILTAINHFGLASWTLDTADPTHPIKLESQLRVGSSLTGDSFFSVTVANDLELKPAAERRYCSAGRPGDTANLAFLASGTTGFYVVDVTDPSAIDRNSGAILGSYNTDGQAVRFGVDPLHDLLYVADGGQGVKVYDVSDPCTSSASSAINNGSLSDPRLIGSIDTGGNANVPFVVDPDTGIAYSGAQNTSATDSQVFSFSLFPPPVSFVADTDRDGRWEDVSSAIPLGVANATKDTALQVAGPGAPHIPYSPDVVRVLANVAGGAGSEIDVEVDATNRNGFGLPPSPPGFPAAKNVVALRRQSDDPADPAFNRYLSPPIVLVADPRAQAQYARTAAETDSSNPHACHNCTAATEYASELASLSSGATFGTSDSPASTAVEQIAGDRLSVSLSDATAGGEPLTQKLTYLSQAAIGTYEAVISTIRADLTPSLQQSPAENPSLFASEAEVAVDTHSGEAQTSQADLSIKGRGLDFVVTRNYISGAIHFGPFGRNIDSPLFARLRPLPSGDVDYYPGDGRRFTFHFNIDHFEAPAGVFLDLCHPAEAQYLLITPEHALLSFNAEGRLTRLSDRNTTLTDCSDGNSLKFLYGGDGKLTTVLDATDRPISFSYDRASGLLSAITDFDGRTVTYGYNSLGELTSVLGPDPQSTQSVQSKTTLAWNGGRGNQTLRSTLLHAGELASVNDGLSRTVFAVGYDGGNPGSAQAVTEGGGTWQIAAGPSGTVTDPNGNVTTYTHDAAGHATIVQRPDAAKPITMTYDSEGRLQAARAPLGDQVAYLYGVPAPSANSKVAFGDVTRVTQYPREGSAEAAGNMTRVTNIAYEPRSNQVTSYQAPASALVTITRDSRGNPTLVQNGTLSTSLTVDTHGLVTQAADSQTGQKTYTYEKVDPLTLGYLTAVTDSAGTTSHDVDHRGNVTQTTDASGNSTLYTVNALDQVEKDARGGSYTTTIFDAAGNMTTRDVFTGTDGNGIPVYSHATYSVDAVGRMDQRIENGRQTAYTYDPGGNLKTVTRSDAPSVVYAYDSRNRMSSMTVGTKASTYAYDEDDSRTSTTNARGKTTSLVLNGFGESVSEIDPMAVQTVSTVDAAGRPVDVKTVKAGPNNTTLVLRWSQTQYDLLGRVTKEIRKLFTDPLTLPTDGTEPLGATDVVTQTIYDDPGHRTTVTDPRGLSTVTEADSLGRTLRITDPIGNKIEYAYFANGNKKSETTTEIRPDGGSDVFVTEYGYDNQNRVTKVTDASDPNHPLSTSYTYDPRGLKLTETDAEGHVSSYEYDLNGQRTRAVLPGGIETDFTYDNFGRLLTIKDAKGTLSTYSYDSEGHMAGLTWADGTKVSYSYDDNDNLAQFTDPNGTVTSQSFDDNDRLIRKDFHRATGVEGPDHEVFTLDDLGRVISAENGTTATDLKYDSLDRTLSETVTLDGQSYLVAHDFDLAGNPIGLTYPSGRKLAMSIDGRNRVSQILEGSIPITSFSFTGSRTASRTLGNNLVESMSYDPDRRLTEILQGISNQPPADDITYGWTGTRRKTFAGRAALDLQNRFTYDPALRLTQETVGLPLTGPPAPPQATVGYNLDTVDNIVSVTDSRTGTTGYSVDNRDRVTLVGGQSQGWDASGDLSSKASGDALTYDAANRLIRVSHGDGSKDEFTYDTLGRRVERSTTIGTNTARTIEVPSGFQTIAEFKGTALDREYIWGNSPDELVEIDRDTNGDGVVDQRLYPLQDSQGSITALTDASGATVERYAYEAYGQTSILAPDNSPRASSFFGNVYLWQGRPWTGDLGFFRARYFDSSARIWTTPDPLTYSSPAANLYTGFNLDGGINGTDPLGAVYNEGMDKDFRAMRLGLYADQDQGPSPAGELGQAAAKFYGSVLPAAFIAEGEFLQAFGEALATSAGQIIGDPGATAQSVQSISGLHARHHIFVNGILNSPAESANSASLIRRAYPGDSVDDVYNPSYGPASDLVQSAMNILVTTGQTKRLLEAEVLAQIEPIQRVRYVVVHAHSQGALIAVDALSALPARDRKSTVLLTYGGANSSWPSGLLYHHAFANWDDPIALGKGVLIGGGLLRSDYTIRSSPYLKYGGFPFGSVRREHGFTIGYNWAVFVGEQMLEGR